MHFALIVINNKHTNIYSKEKKTEANKANNKKKQKQKQAKTSKQTKTEKKQATFSLHFIAFYKSGFHKVFPGLNHIGKV